MQDAVDLIDAAVRLFLAALVLLGLAMMVAVVEWLVCDEDVDVGETRYQRQDETVS